MADRYLLEDGSGYYLLEDGSGYYLLEDQGATDYVPRFLLGGLCLPIYVLPLVLLAGILGAVL